MTQLELVIHSVHTSNMFIFWVCNKVSCLSNTVVKRDTNLS